MKVHATLVLAAVVLASGACTEHEFEPPDRGEQVDEAERLYSSTRFDTIAWPSDSARALEGNSVYSSECRQCHGPLGRGETDYVEERDFHVPSLVEEGWPYADSLDAVRRRIFAGHPGGMPTWGVAGITAREIDASAFYIVEVLRPDVLGGAMLPGEAVDSASGDEGAGAGSAGP